MNRSRVPLLAAVGLALLPWLSFAQEGITLSGTVKDAQSAALPGATVTAIGTASGATAVATTDASGRYEFKSLPTGSYRVSARMPGFSESGRTIAITRGSSQTLDFSLGLGGLEEAITVTAAKGERATAEIPQMITVVSSEDIENRRPQGTQEAFERAPNIQQIDANPYRARPLFRGFANARILLVIDGERLNNGRYDAAASGITPSTIDVTQIESIEVVGGSASSLYGSDAVAGTINIITKTADRPLSGSELALKGYFDFNSNSKYRRGNLAGAFATPKFAIRGAYSNFDQPNYHTGKDPIPLEDVLRFGNFSSGIANITNTNFVTTYAVYELPAHSEVVNAEARGYTANLDAAFHPSEKQSFRVKYAANRFKDLGLPFSAPPFDPFLRVSQFADFDKFSGRYEIREVTSWLPRVSVSAYHQELSRPQNDVNYSFAAGSSFSGRVLTGGLTKFILANDTYTLNTITSKGGDLQLNIVPIKDVQLTAGLSGSQDRSVDTFNRSTYSPTTGAVLSQVTGAKTTPDTEYKNLGLYGQLEWTVKKRVRLSGGLRADNWKTEAFPTAGFPAGNEFDVLKAALPQILSNPGPTDPKGLDGLDQLVAGTGSLTTDRTITTGNIGATLLLPGGINPYIRWANSYREPEITVRYLVRNFGSTSFSIPSIPNISVAAERGENIDVGIKVDRSQVKAQIGYFKNELSGAVGTVFTPTYCIPANPAAGILPTLAAVVPACGGTQHAVQFFQRINVPGGQKAEGYEAAVEVSIPVGTRGSFSPFLAIGTLKPTIAVLNAAQRRAIDTYYNSSAPLKLEDPSTKGSTFGTASGTFALKYNDGRGRYWVEYEWRFQGATTRVDPLVFSALNTNQYGGQRGLEGWDKHAIRAGYSFRNKTVPIKLTAGVDNLLDTTYFLQNSPMPGRSFVLGATIDWKKAF